MKNNMGQMILYTIPAMLRNSFDNFGVKPSLLFAGENNRTFSDLESEVNCLAVLLMQKGISKGDKVAILSTNMPNWGIAFFAVAMVGGVAVPILPDFSQNEIRNILEHSETKALFISESLYSKIEDMDLATIKLLFLVDTFAIIPEGSDKKDILKLQTKLPDREIQPAFAEVKEDDLASIIYTSGTTGKSKGVMLSHRNLVWDAQQSGTIQHVVSEDRFLSLLPLSHTYENTLGLLLPIMNGASVHYMKKPPTPNVLLPALKIVRPTIMLSVPMIIEKIYKKQIEPKFSLGMVKYLYKIGPVRKMLNKIAGKKLLETFGGQLHFFGVGGSKLEGKVEKFLREAKFPYAIGYGLTETSPLLAGAGPEITRFQGIGPVMQGVELKINNPDPVTGQGEVWVKGPNVMKGYYKDPELTKEVMTEDGWFKTGDLGVFDQDGFLFLRGRLKNMILGASGENIYPEEIESVINNFQHVLESLVVERKGRLVALVHLNMEELETKYHSMLEHAGQYKEQAEQLYNQKINEIMAELQHYVNSRVNKFSQIQMVLNQDTPFERTPTQKIKRFLYS
jgi:long-chain acyl-CoA synthetase